MKFSAIIALSLALGAAAGSHDAAIGMHKRAKHFGRVPSKRTCKPRTSSSVSALPSVSGAGGFFGNATATATSAVSVPTGDGATTVTSVAVVTVHPSSSVSASASVHTSAATPATKAASTTEAAPTTKAASTTEAAPTSKAVSTSTKAATTKASSSSAPAATSSSSSSGLKKGLGFNDVSATTAFSSAVSWAYNWDSAHSGALPAGVEFVPMLWGIDAAHTGAWAANAQKAIDNGSGHLLAFNEPDLPAQSDISPADAAAAWKKYMEPFSGKAQLVSPAVTNGAAPMGTAWLDSFIAECTGCHIDAIAIHIYDAASNVQYFKDYITDVGNKYNKPVWVTEFGASGSTGDQQGFLQTMLPFLDGLDHVERYSYFGDFANTFVSTSGSLLALGEAYKSA